jgi:hypothetical protein
MSRLKRFLGGKQSLDLIEYTLLISFIVLLFVDGWRRL